MGLDGWLHRSVKLGHGRYLADDGGGNTYRNPTVREIFFFVWVFAAIVVLNCDTGDFHLVILSKLFSMMRDAV